LSNDTRIPIVDWIERYGRLNPEKPALIDLSTNSTLSFYSLDRRIDTLSNYLVANGVNKGDRVAFLCFNSSIIIEIIFACWRIGAICLPINYRLTASEVVYIVNDAGPKVAFVDQEFESIWHEVLKEFDQLKTVSLNSLIGDSDYEDIVHSYSRYENTNQKYLDDQCLLMYSSGTTGKPKGVIITHKMVHFGSVGALLLGVSQYNRVALANMPMFHIGCLALCFPTLFAGATLVIMRSFDPEETLKAIDTPSLGITTIFGVPAAFNAMKSIPIVESVDFSRLETVITGAEAVPISLVEWWINKGVILQEAWGMTETTASGCLLPKENIPSKVGSAGKSMIFNEIRIVKIDGTIAKTDELGEIQIRGSTVTPGYWNNKSANEISFDGEWFKTGDIGKIDDQEFIFIKDRIKDMYISGGENVYPAEVEDELSKMSEIIEVAIIGVPDEKWGEVGSAFVSLKEGSKLDVEKIWSFLEGKLAKFKWPIYMVEVPALPRGGTGKVLKFELRNKIQA
jgi:fatty-acyl-CoA synthase